mmetsp:Transcript_15787/g.19331  ORF Transcript_15787/g.19331 Transcript_15787/m.19331 type:complete len:155 (-) Transcript_15787:26-490(-)
MLGHSKTQGIMSDFSESIKGGIILGIITTLVLLLWISFVIKTVIISTVDAGPFVGFALTPLISVLIAYYISFKRPLNIHACVYPFLFIAIIGSGFFTLYAWFFKSWLTTANGTFDFIVGISFLIYQAVLLLITCNVTICKKQKLQLDQEHLVDV